jgi:hypothetical protein
MPWVYCAVCGHNYNDAKGGCTNTACKAYVPGKSSPPPLVAKSVPVTPPISLTQAVGKSSVATTLGKTAPFAPPKPMSLGTPPPLKPTGLSTPPQLKPPSLAPPLPAVVTTASTLSTALPQPFDLTLYRGEKSEWWPPPKKRLVSGMTLYEPWEYNTMDELWAKLRSWMRDNASGTPAGFAQYLRATGRPFALATARTKGGAFDGYSYQILIRGARTFHWGPDFTLGPPANFITAQKVGTEIQVGDKRSFSMVDSVSADYIVLNADTISASTILGFGHKTGTYEVTLFHDLPLSYVVTCDGKLPSTLGIMTKEAAEKLPDNEENRRAKKLLR